MELVTIDLITASGYCGSNSMCLLFALWSVRDSSSASPATVSTTMACAAAAQNVQMVPMRRLKYVQHIFARSPDSDVTTVRASCVRPDAMGNKIVSMDRMRDRNYVEV